MDRGHKPHSSNKCIVLYIPVSEPHTYIKAVIYPQTAQIHITGSRNPIIYDHRGVLELSVLLGKVSEHLSKATGYYMQEHVHEWVVYHYHLSVDMIHHTFDKRDAELSIEEFGNAFLRFYTKSMPDGQTVGRLESIKRDRRLHRDLAALDGQTVGRLESIKSPQTTVAEEFDGALFSADRSMLD